ncbi:hypothetical protein ACP275_01G046800 [Erythranthe tilingii]
MEGGDQVVLMKEEKLPPGFRFHPTDEELITYYLINKISDANFTARAVADVDLNKCEPWDLPGKAKMGEKEWYFFSLRDRKYPTGVRTNRATTTGYWKTTGKDKEIFNSNTSELVGMKKTLVFYKGRAPRGEKSNWVMHEYRFHSKSAYRTTKQDEWVVCRVFQKSVGVKKLYSSNQLSRAVINNPNYHYTNEILLHHSNNNNNPMQLLPQFFIQQPPPPPPDNNNFHFPPRNYYNNTITPPDHNHIQDFNKVFNGGGAASTSTAVNYAAGGGGGCFTISGLNLNLGGGGGGGGAAAAQTLMNQQINVGSYVHEGGGGYDHRLIDGGNAPNNNNRFMDQCGDLDNYWPSFN